MSVTPSFQGELQFRRYSDTSTQGQQVVFCVADREALEPFIGKEGKRYMAVLVEIGDDEQPVQRKDTRGPLCREACDYCAMPEFWQFLAETQGAERVRNEADAKDWMCTGLDITSRKVLDEVKEVGSAFVSVYRIPFMRWRKQRVA